MAAELFVVGLSYKTAPLEIRERVALSGEAIEEAVRYLNAMDSVGEALVLSTCNRVEVFAAGTSAVAHDVRAFFGGAVKDRGITMEALDPHLYVHAGPGAVKHIFRVAASLDSQVVGEPQILGQLKDAHGVAQKVGCVGPLLGRCLERAFGVAKRVRTETAIARGAASVSSVAVELAQRVFGDLHGKSVLIIGAGKMSALAARHLVAAGAGDLQITNRSPQRAADLVAKIGGVAHEWSDLEELLTHADVVLSSTGAREPVVTAAMLRHAMKVRRHRPIFLIDIAVPRDIEPVASKLDGVYLFDIDDLERVAAENRKSREREVTSAERIIEAETAQFLGWLRAQGVVPTIKDLRERFTQVAAAEVDKTLAALAARLEPADAKAVKQMADTIVNKLLHTPLMALKNESDAEALVAATRRLFALPDESVGAGGPDPAPPGGQGGPSPHLSTDDDAGGIPKAALETKK